MADLVLPALAQTLALYVPGVGHVYDQSDTDPTPDTITMPSDGRPPVGFVDPYQGAYDVGLAEDGRPGAFGFNSNTSDRSTVLCIVFIGPLALTQIGTLQRRARPFARWAIKDAIRQHNTLGTNGAPVWRAIAKTYEAGPFAWGSDTPNWYVVRVPIEIICDRSVTPGS